MKTRVQVPDLERPDQLTVAPVQSDTFAAPARPPIDNSMAQLAEGLGAFARGVNIYARFREQEDRRWDAAMQRAEKERATADYELWKAQTITDDQLAAFRAGKVDMLKHPIIGSAVRKDFAELEAQDYAKSIDRDIFEGKIQIGSADFKDRLEPYLIEKARPYIEKFATDGIAMATFRRGMEHVRESVSKLHQKALGEQQTAALERIAVGKFEGAVLAGLHAAQGAPPEKQAAIIGETIRGVYKELGPVAHGGTLGIPYGRQDELYLKVLDKLADSPATARIARELLTQERIDLMDGKTVMAPLAGTAKHYDRTYAITEKAIKNEKAAEKQIIDELTKRSLAEKFARPDGSFNMAKDFAVPSQDHPGHTHRVDIDAMKKEVIQNYLNTSRAAILADESIPPEVKQRLIMENEVNVFVGNMEKHPEWFSKLEQGYAGLGALLTRSGEISPGQLQVIQEAGDLYVDLVKAAPAYVEHFLSNSKAREFYRYYEAAKNDLGLNSSEAVAMIRNIYSKIGDKSPEEVEKGNARLIDQLTTAIDTNAWYWLGGGVNNTPEMKAHLVETAKLYVLAGMLDVKPALEKAKKMMNERTVEVNGAGIVGVPGMKKEDGEYFERYINYVSSKYAEDFRLKGYEGPLTVAYNRNAGLFFVRDQYGRPVEIPVKTFERNSEEAMDGKTRVDWKPWSFSLQQIRAGQAVETDAQLKGILTKEIQKRASGLEKQENSDAAARRRTGDSLRNRPEPLGR